jgi:hypothetical protein
MPYKKRKQAVAETASSFEAAACKRATVNRDDELALPKYLSAAELHARFPLGKVVFSLWPEGCRTMRVEAGAADPLNPEHLFVQRVVEFVATCICTGDADAVWCLLRRLGDKTHMGPKLTGAGVKQLARYGDARGRDVPPQVTGVIHFDAAVGVVEVLCPDAPGLVTITSPMPKGVDGYLVSVVVRVFRVLAAALFQKDPNRPSALFSTKKMA